MLACFSVISTKRNCTRTMEILHDAAQRRATQPPHSSLHEETSPRSTSVHTFARRMQRSRHETCEGGRVHWTNGEERPETTSDQGMRPCPHSRRSKTQNVEGRLTTKAFFADLKSNTPSACSGLLPMTRVSVRPGMLESSWKSRGMGPAVVCPLGCTVQGLDLGLESRGFTDRARQGPWNPRHSRRRRAPNGTICDISVVAVKSQVVSSRMAMTSRGTNRDTAALVFDQIGIQKTHADFRALIQQSLVGEPRKK